MNKKELEALQSQLLAEAQADFDRQIFEDLYNAKEAAHQHDLIVKGLQVEGLVDRNLTTLTNLPKSDYKDLIIGAINEHLSSKGIDPSTVELHFSDYKLTYDGGSVIVEEQETPITNILREK
jgi:hypothetical protein